MASLINIFVPLELFLREIEPFVRSAELYVYTEVIGAVRTISRFDWTEGARHRDGDGRLHVFITSEPFDEAKNKSFYDDNFFMYVIELKGGRCTGKELEKLSLRVVAKDPDKRVKSFINKLQKYLKGSETYHMGIGPGNYYSKFYYHRLEVQNKTLWFDFDRKFEPVIITM